MKQMQEPFIISSDKASSISFYKIVYYIYLLNNPLKW